MNTLRFGILKTLRADGLTRYVIVDTHTGQIVDGGLRTKQIALNIAACLVLSTAAPDEDHMPTAEELGLQFPSGDDLCAAWEDHVAGAETPV